MDFGIVQSAKSLGSGKTTLFFATALQTDPQKEGQTNRHDH